MKTANLTEAALDWAVAKCEVGAEFIGEIDDPHFYSTDWALGGEIIERERIALIDQGGDYWQALCGWSEAFGDTPLIAAMRCYVASKLGDEIELPEGLTHE
jgi:hypothetical protein